MKKVAENHWWPEQRMPLEFFIDDKGQFIYYPSCNSPKRISLDQALQLAKDAEILAQEIREAVEIAKSMKVVPV